MEYELKRSNRTLIVTPFNGDSLDYDRDFSYFINFALEHNYSKLKYCKSIISLYPQSNKILEHPKIINIKNKILESYKIIRNKYNNKPIIFVDGLRVYTDLKLKEIYRELENVGYCITNNFEFAKYFKVIYFAKNYIIIFSDDDIWFSNGVIDIEGHKFNKIDGLIIKGEK